MAKPDNNMNDSALIIACWPRDVNTMAVWITDLNGMLIMETSPSIGEEMGRERELVLSYNVGQT